MKIALISIKSLIRGVQEVVKKLHKGLKKEGYEVEIIEIGSVYKHKFFSVIKDDFSQLKNLTNYDAIIYSGSIPWPNHLILKMKAIPIILFLHGFVHDELFQMMKHGDTLRIKTGAMVNLVLFEIAKHFNSIDLYILHSLTSCEINGIFNNFVILPNWIFLEEIFYFNKIEPENKNKLRIVTYTHESPRLMKIENLIEIGKKLKPLIKQDFEIIIINPKYSFLSDSIKVIKPLPHKKFLSLLASADLYIERTIDEELGISTIEAMSLGVPVAKLTHPIYLNRHDYKEDIILATSFRELVYKIAEYLNNVDYYHCYYSNRVRKFILEKRTWDHVKIPFLIALKKITKNN